MVLDNLKLITTENFECGSDDLSKVAPCDFWVDENGEYLVTREQIGKALGYSNPSKAIEKIHLRHKDRLDKYSYLIKSEISRSPQSVGTTSNGSIQGRRFYSRKGIMEICRWSNKPVANDFVDWVWDVIDGLISKSIRDNNNIVSKEMVNTVNEISISVKEIEREVSRRSKCSFHYSSWRAKVAQKVKVLAFIHKMDTNAGIKTIYGRIYGDMRIYGKDINDYKEEYLNQFPDLDGIPSGIEIVEYFGELRELFDNILDNWLIRELGLEKD